MTDIEELAGTGIAGDLMYTLPEADTSSKGTFHRVSSQLSEHNSGSKVVFEVPNLGYLNSGSWINVPVKSSLDNTQLDNVYACFSQLRVLINGVEVSNVENYNVLGSMFLKDHPYGSSNSITEVSGVRETLPHAANTYNNYIITFPKNYVLNPDKKLPLKNFSTNVLVELTVAPSGAALRREAGNPELTVGRCEFHLNLSDVDSEFDSEIMNRMIEADSNPDLMIPLVFDDFKTLSTNSPATTGTQVLVYNDLVSSMKSLRLVLQNSANRVSPNQYAGSSTFIRNNITQYQIKANGQNLIQNPVECTGGAPDAYLHYLDVASHYFPEALQNGTMFQYHQFTNDANAYGDHHPVYSPSFQACVDVDSQNRDLLRGLKVLNSLAVEITKDGNGANCTAILVENFNRIVFLSRSKLRLIR